VSDPNPTTPTRDPIDRGSLLERCMGDAGFASIILGKFQSRLGSMAAAVEAASVGGDAAAAGRAGHALKGAAANLSAAGVEAVAAQVEAAGAGGDVAAVARLVPQLWAEVARCLSFLPTLAAELSRSAAV
jgi:HPt (histidine-containing phosphotransfer) domain-containing protein